MIAVIDAGMTDLIRPSHYQAYHEISVVGANGRQSVAYDVVGPICESGDFLALDRELPELEQGDLVAVHGAGAYGFVMTSTYNARPRPPEVLVDGDRWAVIRERETPEDLMKGEWVVPDWHEPAVAGERR
jgi:diaminopimelate decarboxylase